MIKVENIEVWGFKHAIRGMRNPLNSWDKSDSMENGCTMSSGEESCPGECGTWCSGYGYVVGPNDLSLMRRLFKGGTEHRKYLRQIFVSLDITAPLYWWKEFDTYKVGTVANSCSTMHKIASKEFTEEDFSWEHLYTPYESEDLGSEELSVYILQALNRYRERYLKTKNKGDWWQMIQLLPSSYNQKRTITFNYENVYTILRQRAGHKLDEWNELCAILTHLPYIREIAEVSDND